VPDKETLSTQVPKARKRDVERYQRQHGHDSLSKAAEELISVGLRESSSPLLYRAKDLSIEAAWYLSIGGIIAILLGFTTSGFTPADGVRIAAVFISVGASLIAGVELVRYVTGNSAIEENGVAAVLAGLR